jgi:hypothetical protein
MATSGSKNISSEIGQVKSASVKLILIIFPEDFLPSDEGLRALNIISPFIIIIMFLGNTVLDYNLENSDNLPGNSLRIPTAYNN